MGYCLKNATLITEDAKVIPGKDICISGGKITKICDSGENCCEEGFETVDCTGLFVSPGLTNLHTHLAMNIFKGIAEDATPDEWFNELIFPYESKMTEEDIYVGTMLGLCELINNGVTAVADHYFGEETVLRAVKDSGMRVDMSPTLFGSSPDYKDRLACVCEFIEKHRNDSDRVSFRMGIHSDYTCPPDTLAEMGEAAGRLGVPIHMHLYDDRDQITLSKERYGKSVATVVKEAGLLKHKILFAHCLWMEEELLDHLTDDCFFAFCPKTYLKMGLGKGTFFDFYEKLNFSFGTDGAASSNTLNPVEQARLFALICKFDFKPKACKVDEMWRYLMRGHDALNFGTGKLKEGTPADLVIWDFKTCDTMMTYNPITSILYSSNSSNARYTMVGGEFLKYDGRLKTDFVELAKRAERLRDDMLRRGKGEANVSYLK
ncbi:MAG: amidohydrolase family protein [Lachnospiraceae bacterium]|nr:amidohydrolase family protein [Lachnospiraceae bacterium]